MCQRSLADLPRGKQQYQHIPERSVSNLRFSLRTEASHTQARMPAPSWYRCERVSIWGPWVPPGLDEVSLPGPPGFWPLLHILSFSPALWLDCKRL